MVEVYSESGELTHEGMLEDGLQCGDWTEQGETVSYPECAS